MDQPTGQAQLANVPAQPMTNLGEGALEGSLEY